ncbi:MAG TPA: NAD(+) synthase [candidate division Zixibacteria bacterium]|nr:NAD(+) synthase [candidate division Zixibacteria bacterium]MDM7972772.1 NAD(+) synthase [candidate division Zixibacteria bacterium]HOD67204.1 NAD(+) synthase [candidate division Zixibacteria bacterium]HPM37318.1 NAD(+) synthase [candidate division Zixibacteria bacterium]HQL24081.1 NAD(+) synthase [candidate division Zixibacteria bacterium]
MEFHKDSLKIDAARVAESLRRVIAEQIGVQMKKRGAVVGISGGIDSSVVAALCATALGPQRVVGVMMPEKDSSPESRRLAQLLAERFGFETILETLTGGLEGMGCYRRRDEAIRQVFPDYGPGYKCKIGIPSTVIEQAAFNYFTLTVEDPQGRIETRRMPMGVYLQVVAASNLKQRLRMTTLYYHAEKRNWAVVGTGNKDEHEQGFFVKWGDGGADLKPIAHLFKTQVFQLARHLGVPDEIVSRTPTTDTYSAEQTQEEFFFGLDFYTMDMLWYAMEHRVPAAEAARVLNLTPEEVERGYRAIQRKIDATAYLRMNPLEAPPEAR